MRTSRLGYLLATACVLLSVGRAVASETVERAPFVVVLGIAQDGGLPHAGCRRDCCVAAWGDESLRRLISCIAVVDPESKQRWLFDCTPDFPQQLNRLDELESGKRRLVDGIFLTHAHIGHYAGLMHLGREVLGANSVPIYAMPRMRKFLWTNGPWSQLATLNNIVIEPLEADKPVVLNVNLSITPFRVPHRDEFSETVGFRIRGPKKTVAFIPDIDKWEQWEARVEDLVCSVDRAYVDGTFFDNDELPGRDMSQIPHPFIVESLSRFAPLADADRSKIRFIHLNHSNPAIREGSSAARIIDEAGCHVARELEVFSLGDDLSAEARELTD